jgi:hypothetical protein
MVHLGLAVAVQQLTGLFTMLEEHLGLAFTTAVLGVES